MRAHKLLLVPAATLFALSGCTLAHSLQLAEPVGRGNTDVSFEAGTGAMVGGEHPLVPHGNLTIRHGVSDSVDVAFRGGSSGWEVGFKRAFAFESTPSLALAGVVRAGFMPPLGGTPLPSARATVGGILQWSPSARLHLLFSPNISLYSITQEARSLARLAPAPMSASPNLLLSDNSDLMLVPMATVGLGYDVLPTARIILEAGSPLHPALLRQANMAGFPLSAAIAIQWRPRDSAPVR